MLHWTRTYLGSLVVVAALAFSSAGAQAQEYWQCAAFARVFSGIQIFGDAWTWWSKASGHYAKGYTPEAGAVLVFKPQGSMRLGHVAVVSQVLTDRIIQVTHANWSRIGGARGKIEQNEVTKIFSIAAVILLPPTLIATWYGMNFKHMPELNWPWAYPAAFLVSIASAALPYLWIRRKGWL